MAVVGEGRGRLLLPGEAAALLRIDPATLSRYARSGDLRSVRLPGGHRRYYEQDVLDILTSKASPAPSEVDGQLELPLELDETTEEDRAT